MTSACCLRQGYAFHGTVLNLLTYSIWKSDLLNSLDFTRAYTYIRRL